MTSGDRPTGTLFVVGTPIGNLADLSPRAEATLRDADLIVAEDTRVTAKLLARFAITTKTKSVREQNARAAVPPIIALLVKGKNVALVTDAGTPSVSDPGEDLVKAAVEAGVQVSPIPGPSALAAAISVAGLEGDGVRFVGFLPRGGKERTRALHSIAEDPSLTVAYESPNRLRDTLKDLAAVAPDRRCAVMRELTKLHEEIVRGTLNELYVRFEAPPRGEITLAIEGAKTDPEEVTEDNLRDLVQAALQKGRTAKDISTSLAKALGIPKKRVYQTALALLDKGSDPSY